MYELKRRQNTTELETNCREIPNKTVRYFQNYGSTAKSAGLSLKIFLIISIFLIGFSINALENQNICERSIVYDNLFDIECMNIFSYGYANDLYDNIDGLQVYIDEFGISDETIYIKYLTYLRKKQLFPAIVSLIIMANNNDYHFNDYDKNRSVYRHALNELINLLEIHSKKADSNDVKNLSRTFDVPVNMDQLSDKLLYSIEAMISKSTSVSKILFSSLMYSISSIPPEFDFNGDDFAKSLLLYLIKLRNEKILAEYISYFADSINGIEPKYSYRTFVILNRLGLNKIDPGSIYKTRNVVLANEFISRTEQKKQNEPDKEIENFKYNKSDDCVYLENRKRWILETMPADRDVLLFNNSAMIVEQCAESFILFAPFINEGNDFIIFNDNLWIRYFVEALDEIVQNRLDEEKATELLEAGFRASLWEGRDDRPASWWFFFYLSTREDYMAILKALVLKQTAGLNWKSYNDNSVSEATDLIYKTLYGKGL